MAILSPCQSLNSKIDSLMTEFNTSSFIVSQNVNELNDTLELMKNETGIEDLESQVSSAKGQSQTEMNDLLNTSSNFFGSCLDSITSSLFGVLNESSSYSSNVLNTINGIPNVSNLLSGLGNVKSSLDKLGIPKLLEKIDETLGCLSENNDCIPTDKIDNIMTTINGFLESNGLGETGEFSLDSLLDNIPDMGELIKDNIKNISVSADEIASDAKQNILASTQKAKTYYNELQW